MSTKMHKSGDINSEASETRTQMGTILDLVLAQSGNALLCYDVV
jgi:hypothetical protein